jgi:hypothetical protein
MDRRDPNKRAAGGRLGGRQIAFVDLFGGGNPGQHSGLLGFADVAACDIGLVDASELFCLAHAQTSFCGGVWLFESPCSVGRKGTVERMGGNVLVQSGDFPNLVKHIVLRV